MSTVVATAQFDAPIERVWQVIMDPNQFVNWVTIHRELLRSDSGSLRKGFSIKQKMSVRGAPVTIEWTLESFTEPTVAVWRGKAPAGAQASIRYELEALDSGLTSFVYTNEFKTPGGLLGKVAQKALVGDTAQTEAEASLKRLKAYLES